MNTDQSMNVTMVEALKSVVLNVLYDVLHTCMPAVIDEYDSVKRLAKVTPLVKKKYLDGSELIYQPIVNVPVMYFGTKNSGLRLPEDDFVGQTCLLVFCERSIDLWKAKGKLVEPGNGRKFSLSDGIAIVGLNSFNNKDAGGDDLQLYAHDCTITIKKNKTIKIENGNGNYELKATGQFSVNDGNLTVEP
jgi:hypothetical protein